MEDMASSWDGREEGGEHADPHAICGIYRSYRPSAQFEECMHGHIERGGVPSTFDWRRAAAPFPANGSTRNDARCVSEILDSATPDGPCPNSSPMNGLPPEKSHNFRPRSSPWTPLAHDSNILLRLGSHRDNRGFSLFQIGRSRPFPSHTEFRVPAFGSCPSPPRACICAPAAARGGRSRAEPSRDSRSCYSARGGPLQWEFSLHLAFPSVLGGPSHLGSGEISSSLATVSNTSILLITRVRNCHRVIYMLFTRYQFLSRIT